MAHAETSSTTKALKDVSSSDQAPSAVAASKSAPMQGGPATFPRDPWNDKMIQNGFSCFLCPKTCLKKDET